jgi:hypothetical protein
LGILNAVHAQKGEFSETSFVVCRKLFSIAEKQIECNVEKNYDTTEENSAAARSQDLFRDINTVRGTTPPREVIATNEFLFAYVQLACKIER